MINLTQKERTLLEDQLKHEEICISKYDAYAKQAQNPQLKQLFTAYAAQERQHYDTIRQILSGQVPSTSQSNQQGNQQQAQPHAAGMQNRNDEALCNDILMTEKYVSGTYDTAIFEFRDTNVRKALNHIQKEEQGHGEGVFNFMQANGMYNAQ